MERDRIPDHVRRRFFGAVITKESAGRIRAVDLESMVVTAIFRCEPEVVKHGSEVQQFVIDRKPPVTASNRSEQINPERMRE